MPDAILFDLDGVVYNADEPIPGAVEALAWVRRRRIPHLFLTNTTSRSRAVLVEKLTRFGVEATAGQLWTPLAALRQYLEARPEVQSAFFLPAKALSEVETYPATPPDAESGADCVVVGDLGKRWTYEVLNRAFRLLHSNPAAELISLGQTRYWRSADGGVSLDVAPFAAALECATGRKPIVLGKPARAFFEAACEKLGTDPNRVVMIGDDIRADVGGAQAAGLEGAQVKTGKFRPEDLEGDVRPDYLLDSIADLPAIFESAQ